ncbi:hypothetical protein BCR43DRAFT_339302 [Syncephalastrum racemosum]|uniref:Uncharacterized protein n=1 Tax=Syncephalastrum racemosum TaxID=13706 RepID=A0A1X2H8W7_SYNRA|nr:hypothetical protein BCR43DRAFT_339302 [Syncephalastrum racemosum]
MESVLLLAFSLQAGETRSWAICSLCTSETIVEIRFFPEGVVLVAEYAAMLALQLLLHSANIQHEAQSFVVVGLLMILPFGTAGRSTFARCKDWIRTGIVKGNKYTATNAPQWKTSTQKSQNNQFFVEQITKKRTSHPMFDINHDL